MAEDPQLKIYEQNCKFFRFFLDYRHKFMVRYIVAIAALLASIAFLIENEKFEWIYASLYLFSFISLLFFLVEMRTTIVLIGSQCVGKELERSLADRHARSNPDIKVGSFEKNIWIVIYDYMKKNVKNESSITEKQDEPRHTVGFFMATSSSAYNLTWSHSSILRVAYAVGTGVSGFFAAWWIPSDLTNWQYWPLSVLAGVPLLLCVILAFKAHRKAKSGADEAIVRLENRK